MNRRRFLGGLLAAIAAPKVLLEVAKKHKPTGVLKLTAARLARAGHINEADVIADELAKVQDKITTLFDRDDMFYKMIDRPRQLRLFEPNPVDHVSARDMRVPIQRVFEDAEFDDDTIEGFLS